MDRRAEILIDMCDNEQNIRMLTFTISAAQVYALQGGSNELGSNRRQLEAVQGQRQATVGETHRRSARCNCGQTRSAFRQNPGNLWNLQGRDGETAFRLAGTPERNVSPSKVRRRGGERFRPCITP